jgi:hypothetical protein
MMSVTLDLTALTQRLARVQSRIPTLREHWTRHALVRTVQRVAAHTPIHSGRTVAGWNAALAELGASGPPINGLDVDSDAIQLGAGEGSAALDTRHNVTVATAIHTGPAVRYLEYGTTRRAPLALVQRSVSELKSSLRSELAGLHWWE